MPSRQGLRFADGRGGQFKPKAMTLFQYALMAEEYCRHALAVEMPKVGLFNVGEEKGKGDEVRQEAFELMEASDSGLCGQC